MFPRERMIEDDIMEVLMLLVLGYKKSYWGDCIGS